MLVVQKEIGTLRFGWLEKVAGRGWELPKTNTDTGALGENLKRMDVAS